MACHRMVVPSGLGEARFGASVAAVTDVRVPIANGFESENSPAPEFQALRTCTATR